MRLLLALLAILALATPSLQGVDEAEAGRIELAKLEQQIQVIQGLLEKAGAALDRHHLAELDALADRGRTLIQIYEIYTGPLPTTWQEHVAMYPDLFKRRVGWGVMEPVDSWTHAWIAHRRVEHQLNDQYQDLRLSLQKLTELRRRLRAQLGLAP